MKLSLIVPCYNEEENVEAFAKEVYKTFENENITYEIIYINDGSQDQTLTKLKSLLKNQNQNIKIINLSRNFGKEAAMYAGLKNAKGDYITIIDSDLQQSPKDALKMVKFLENNQDYDIVTAYQDKRNESKILSFFKNTFYALINKMSQTKFKRGASDFRTFRNYVVKSILEVKEYYRFSKGIFSWIGYNNYYMPYTAKPRCKGKTSWSFWKLFKYAIDGIVSFSTVPLRLATITGLILSFFSLLYLIIVIIQKLFFQIPIPGYATIVGLILFIGGFQLLAIGTIGEYLARTYVETKNRPIYIAKEILTNEEENNDKKTI